jgi:hypothetical protein
MSVGIDEYGEIYRKASSRPSGFVPVVSCQWFRASGFVPVVSCFTRPAVSVSRRQPFRSFTIIVDSVSFDQRRMNQ